MHPEDQYKRARKRVLAKKGFFWHLGSYVAVGIFFFTMNMLTDPFDTWWPFPMLGWGIGLATHYFAVFGLPGTDILTKEWEDREMEKELRRMGYDPAQEIYEEEENLEPAEEEELDLREIRRERMERGLDEDEFV